MVYFIRRFYVLFKTKDAGFPEFCPIVSSERFAILVLSLSGLGIDEIKTENKVSIYLLNTREQIH